MYGHDTRMQTWLEKDCTLASWPMSTLAIDGESSTGVSELLLEVVVQDDDAQWEGCKQMNTCGRRKKVGTCEMANTLNSGQG
jgi:hypothetical protein